MRRIYYIGNWVVYLAAASLLGLHIIPDNLDNAGLLLLLFFMGQIIAYVFYLLAVLVRAHEFNLRVRYSFHIPYLMYALPAYIIAYFLIPQVSDNKNLLLAAYHVSLLFQTVFYIAALVTVKNRALQTGMPYRFTWFLPFFMYLLPAAGIGSLIIPSALQDTRWLFIAYFAGMFFSIASYLAGGFLIFTTTDSLRRFAKIFFWLPILFYVAVASLVGIIAIKHLSGKLTELLLAYTAALYGWAMIYYFMIHIMVDKGNIRKNETP